VERRGFTENMFQTKCEENRLNARRSATGVRISTLRARLCQKAKQEQERVKACDESFQESRMREIRTSGSRRGEQGAWHGIR